MECPDCGRALSLKPEFGRNSLCLVCSKCRTELVTIEDFDKEWLTVGLPSELVPDKTDPDELIY